MPENEIYLFQIFHTHGKMQIDLRGRPLKHSFFKSKSMLRAIAVKSVIIFSVKPANLLCVTLSMDSVMASVGSDCFLGMFSMIFLIFFFTLLLTNRTEQRQLKGWMYIMVNYRNGNALL